jgi:transposase
MSYSVEFRKRALNDPGTVRQRAERWRISQATVYRWLKRQKIKDSLEPGPFSRRRPRKLTRKHIFLLAFFKTLFPDALFSQCAKFIRHFDPALHITSYDISRALKRINFTKKKLSRINIKRNSVQRERW